MTLQIKNEQNYVLSKYDFWVSLDVEARATSWFLLDVKRGEIYNGSGYVCIFKTKKQALDFKKKRNSFEGPWKVADMKNILMHYIGY